MMKGEVGKAREAFLAGIDKHPEIVMGHGPKPADDRRGFDARDVIANLSAKIVRPK